MKDNCFPEFCCFLSDINKNQPQVHPCPFPPKPPCHLPSLHTLLDFVMEPLFEVPESYNKLPLTICFTYGIVNFHVILSIHLTLSLLPSSRVHKSVLYVCFSIAALQINSSVPSFQIPYICISIYLSFSCRLTSLCLRGSKIHISCIGRWILYHQATWEAPVLHG